MAGCSSALRGKGPVDHLEHAVAVMQDVVVVGDEHPGDATLAALSREQRNDVLTAPAVQCGGGLVHEEDSGVVDEGARDADALALAARELSGAVGRAVPHVDIIEQLTRIESAGTTTAVGDPVGEAQLVSRSQRGMRLPDWNTKPM